MQQGDKKAFEKIYNAYANTLYGIVLRIVKTEEVATGVLQEVFIKIWKNVKKYDSDKSTFFTWILNIARNTAIDQYRKQKIRQTVPVQDHDQEISFTHLSKSETETDHIDLIDMIKKLSPDQKKTLEYLYFKGYTQQEFSEEQGVPLGTVKTRARTALIALRKFMNK